MRAIDAKNEAGNAVAVATHRGGKALDTGISEAGLSFLFAAGERPSADDLHRLFNSDEFTGHGARISYSEESDKGWVELLASGLTFDLAGLAPAPPAPLPPADHRFGIDAALAAEPLEAVSLVPGPHISGGPAMMPVVRAMAGIAGSLALPLPVRAVCWHPARSWMEPAYFARIIVNWLSGGAFPALGLTAVERAEDGSVRSVGLAFFIGQELRLETAAGEPPAQAVKLAVRVIDHLVRHGPITGVEELQGPSGEAMLAEPSRDRRIVRVWRATA